KQEMEASEPLYTQAETDALVAGAYLAAAGIANECIRCCGDTRKMILALTPADAKAAMDALIAARFKSQIDLSVEVERKDCARALLALAGKYPTPVEGYGCNSSWAISDLCK